MPLPQPLMTKKASCVTMGNKMVNYIIPQSLETLLSYRTLQFQVPAIARAQRQNPFGRKTGARATHATQI
jgi:hypothetical protein